MAMYQQDEQQQQQQHYEQIPSSLFDPLHCQEESCEDEEEINDDNEEVSETNQSLFPVLLLDQNLLWEDEELLSLFSKEKEIIFNDVSLTNERKESVKWMLKVNSHYGFRTLTSVLAVNYFDRFLANFHIPKDKIWTLQLAAVTCLSLAAKVEETHVPLLLDLQVEGAKQVFEPKVIQKMEVLVLSTLEWKMHPVTPLSFLDHIIRRLGLMTHLHWEFLHRCELVLLSLLYDWRFVSYLPSVLATATMIHVIDKIEPCNLLDYQTQLLNVLNFSKEKVNDCYELIMEISSGSTQNYNSNYKRKYEEMIFHNLGPSSLSGVMDAYYLNSDSSNDSWAATTTSHTRSGSMSSSLSVSSSPVTSRKRGRVLERPIPLQLPALSRVFIDIIDSPH